MTGHLAFPRTQFQHRKSLLPHFWANQGGCSQCDGSQKAEDPEKEFTLDHQDGTVTEGNRISLGTSSGGLDSKESACKAGDLGSTLAREDPLEEGMATHSSILAWRIPWTEEPGGL